MTYKPEPNFSTLAAKLTNLKEESIQRSQRVLKIFRAAFTDTVTEIRDSRTVFSSLVKEVTTETIATLKGKSQQLTVTVRQTWQQKINHKTLIENVTVFMSNSLSTAKFNLSPKIARLRQRYGHRYENIREQFDVVRSWYVVPETNTARKKNDHSSDSTVIIEVKSEVIQ